ncbi:MBL fold metallo-hydrolase [Eubacteriales bacterium OttesenSCG-928-N13]|nr:MBL fold metallo-hydrolase [Eubacteriales bacterium OttesenSCG-928-N13]
MEFRFAPLLSGSSGNALYVGAGDTHILVDAGASGARLIPQMQAAGVDPRKLSAILVTHEHSDHVAGVGVMSRKFDLPIYATEGTWSKMGKKIGVVAQNNIRTITAKQDFYMGRINVTPFAIPHDAADPVGYSFRLGAIKCAIATDIGCIQDDWMDEVAGSDVLLLEANHDVDMLKAGRYPYELKRRILSRRGHLSNDDCGKAAAMLGARGVRHIILGHLSNENNHAPLAQLTVENALREAGIEPGEQIMLSVAKRDMLCGVFSLGIGGMAGE